MTIIYILKKHQNFLGVHWQTLKNWEKSGKIKCIKSPGGKRYYDVNTFMIKNNSRKAYFGVIFSA